VRLGPEGLATHEVSGQTSPGASLSQREASCVQLNISIWLRRFAMVHQSAPPAFRQPVARDPGPAKHAHARTSQPCYFSISHAALAARELQEDVFQREVDISGGAAHALNSLPLSRHRGHGRASIGGQFCCDAQRGSFLAVCRRNRR
jgi:hypothetical protein